VRTEPHDLDRLELTRLLEDRWELRLPQLEYMPVGFGSHHWSATDPQGVRHVATVDVLDATFRDSPDADAAFVALERALRTAASLRNDAALEFVVAPLATADGAILHRLSARYALSVFPFVDGESSEWGPYEEPRDRRALGAVLGRLHRATVDVAHGLPRRDDFAIPSRAALVDALHHLDDEWHLGPFAEPTRKLLRASARALSERLHAFDDLAARVRTSSDGWVVTHGEPHRANVIRGSDGRVYLVDWDTALLAPRERDLWMVLDEDRTGWREYREHFGDAALNHEALVLYREWWELADIASFAAALRRPHERTDDTLATWRSLESYLT
jgi:spectinomycin phosphotransferase